METVEISRREILDVWTEEDCGLVLEKIPAVQSAIAHRLQIVDEQPTEGRFTAITNAVRSICYRVRTYWHSCKKNRHTFEKKYGAYLDTPQQVQIPLKISCTNKGGRPSLPFKELSERSQRRNVEELRANNCTEKLALAAAMNAREEKREDAAKLVTQIMLTSPGRASKISNILKQAGKGDVSPYSEDEALSLMIELNLSRNGYQTLRLGAKLKCPQSKVLYPSVKKVKAAKERCLPPPETMVILSDSARVDLKSLLDHTANRLVSLQEEVLKALSGDKKFLELVMFSKWGFDGSSGHSNHKHNDGDKNLDDSTIIITSLVPLSLTLKGSDKLVWFNSKSSSTRLCRPIKLEMTKETTEFILQEKSSMDLQIQDVQNRPTECVIADVNVKISHTLACTMIDGKICSALTGVSTSRCPVCKGYPRQFNNLQKVLKMPTDKSALEFGLSPLHMYIRFMECCLHIAYRIDFKKTRTLGDNKPIRQTRKESIQTALKSELCIIVDVPKQGSGTTNDGNTARKFFKHPVTTARILGISEELVRRFAVILQALNSGFHINVNAFREFGLATANFYVQHYKWFHMPPTVHRVLIHGAEIIAAAKGPIGTLSEEPQESRNKDIRNFREFRARHISRVACMTDIFTRLLVTSDPKISSYRRPPSSNKRDPLSEGVRALLTVNSPGASCADDVDGGGTSTDDDIDTVDEDDMNTADEDDYFSL